MGADHGSFACKLFFWHVFGNLARPTESVHTDYMRTNVNLADDARQFAEVYAHANGITLGDAITDLIRKSSRTDTGASEAPRFGRTASGFPTFPRSEERRGRGDPIS